MNGHAGDNAKDRATGAYWEREFGKLAGIHGKVFTPHQLHLANKSAASYRWGQGQWHVALLPDITVWSAPGEHHEIKHKDATRTGRYGLEEYRLRALVAFAEETQQPVLYTIHDWRRAGASSSAERVPNRLCDWVCADILELAAKRTETRRGTSYVAGTAREVDIAYWCADEFFFPLAQLWKVAA